MLGNHFGNLGFKYKFFFEIGVSETLLQSIMQGLLGFPFSALPSNRQGNAPVSQHAAVKPSLRSPLTNTKSSSITNLTSATRESKSSIDYVIIGLFDNGHVHHRHARFCVFHKKITIPQGV